MKASQRLWEKMPGTLARWRIMPKVAHLTSAHAATDVRIFQKECRTLAQAGLDVVLIAPHDHNEIVDGVRIRAVPRSRGRRERFTTTQYQVFRAAVAENAHVYHFHDPDLLPIAIALRARGAKVIYDVHENYAEAIKDKYWLPKLMRTPMSWATSTLERYSGMHGFVAATPSIASQFIADRTVVVQNFPFRAEFASAGKDTPFRQRPIYIGYAGGISSGRCAIEMIDALHLAGSTEGGRALRLRLAGNIIEPGLRAALKARPGWARVDYLGHLDRGALARMFGELRLGLVLFKPLGNHVNAQPNKLFEYMSAGLPVVCSNFPLWRDIVEANRCGLCVEPNSPADVARAITYLLGRPEEAEAMGRAGRAAVLDCYNWETEAKKLCGLYRKLLPRW